MSELLHAVELSGSAFSERLLHASWQGGVVLAIVCVIARCCTFLSPRVVCWVLRLACLKLVVALLWVEPIDLPLLPVTPAGTMPREIFATPSTTLPLVQAEQHTLESLEVARQTELPPRTAADRIGWLQLFQALWLVGFCGSLMFTIKHWIAIRQLCRTADPMPSTALRRSFSTEVRRLEIRRMPDLRLSPHVDSPLLARIWRPTVILPGHVEESFDESEVRLMMAHELAHLKRHDLLWNWLPTIVGWLFWFHPLVWLMKRLWCEAQEAACDELLIQNRVARPVEYGRLLLKLAAGGPRKSDADLLAVRMFGSYRNLKWRILTMTRVRAFSRSRLLIAAAILPLVAIPGLIPWRLIAQEPDQAAQPAVTSPTQHEEAAEKSLRSETQDLKFTAVARGGLSAFSKRDYAQALARFDEAIRLDPNHSEARRWRGDALLNQGELDKALSAYEDAIRLDPKNALAYVSRGMAWTEKRELGPALIAFGTAIELDPMQAKRPHVQRYVAAAQSLLGSGPIAGFGHPEKEKSPFAAVRWQKSEPEVKVGDEWLTLVSLDGISVSEIVDFSKKNFGDRWKMRFEEDLVELLTRMGHPPKDTVTLIVQTQTPSETRTLKDVPMTAANRWTIKVAAEIRKTLAPQGERDAE